jgi:hypothetical protein
MFGRVAAAAWECLTVDGITVFTARAEAPVENTQLSSRGVLVYIPSLNYDTTVEWLTARGPRPVQGPIDPRTPAPTAGRIVEDDD